MTDGPDFDIYQGGSGYVAVTNPVRRTILEALAERDRELPDLMRITGRSKPTLSNLHVRELLAQKLVEELPHPTDARKKVYRLAARRIGRSSVPLEQLRSAVKQYVAASPLAYAVPFPKVLDALAAGAGPSAKETLRRQGVALGASSAHLFPEADAREAMTSIAAFLEREGIGRTTRMDFDKREFEVELSQERLHADAARDALAGFVEGILRAGMGLEGAVTARGKARRVILVLPAK